MNLSSPKTINGLLVKYALSPLKKYGQNFLVDDNILNNIADAVDYSCGFVLEIGAGLGGLTAKLAQRARKVLAYEIDRGFCRALIETLGDFSNITIKNEDILKADIKKDTEDIFGGTPFFVAANLPYYITSPVIMRLLEDDLNICGMALMMQKEVAMRLCAKPGGGDYGAITAAVNLFADIHLLFDVSKNCFYPRPDVYSTVVRFDIKEYDSSIKDPYLKFVKGLFAARRKTVFNNLVHNMGFEKDKALELLEKSGINPKSRAETLSADDFMRLAKVDKEFSR